MLDPKTIRNVAIIAHDGAGKTCLTEALLRHDAPSRASKDGSTSHLDVDPEETKRNFTVATHITFAEHDGVMLNLLDAPGFSDFLTDADRSMAVCEGGLLLVSAVSGVKHQTEAHWDMAAERSLPLLACVNKLDKERASFLRAVDDMDKTLQAKPVALQLPAGLGEDFNGVIDLLTMRCHVYSSGRATVGGGRRAARAPRLPQHRRSFRRPAHRVPGLLWRDQAGYSHRQQPHRARRDGAARLPDRREPHGGNSRRRRRRTHRSDEAQGRPR